MNLIQKAFNKGIVTLRVTDLDDLWYLSHIIDPGDLVKGKTTRKIKIGEDKVTKKTITVAIEAETIELSEDGHSLRINGKIRQGTDEVPLGSYQAIALEEGSECTIQKNLWLGYQKQKLEEAAEKKYTYLLCVFDREEAILALTKKGGCEVLTTLKGDVQKKAKTNELTKDFYSEITKALELYTTRYNPERIILASPAFYKDDFYKKMPESELKKKIVLAISSDVGESSLDEVLKRPELAEVLKSSRAREEQLLVDHVLSEINKNNLAVYGWKDVQTAVTAGAVSAIILTDQFIFQRKSTGTFLEVDEILKHVEALQGKIHLISSEHEGGKKINGLGGIAALLRYKLTW